MLLWITMSARKLITKLIQIEAILFPYLYSLLCRGAVGAYLSQYMVQESKQSIKIQGEPETPTRTTKIRVDGGQIRTCNPTSQVPCFPRNVTALKHALLL